MIKKLSHDLHEELVQIRRELHKIPEMGLFEYKTSAFIKSKLDEYGIYYKSCFNTGIIAYINKGKAGKTILLRADIDALPLDEETNLEFSSEHPGVMHACGHDFHMACLLGASKILNDIKDEINGSIVFVFQPDEEGEGGARQMIANGALEGVNAAFSLHIEPLLETGNVYIRDGAIMASPDYFILDIAGKGGHGACPEKCKNPISIGCEITEKFHKLSEETEGVVSVCSFESGTQSPNIIPDTAHITGTVRSVDNETRTFYKTNMYNIINDTCKKYDADFNFDYHDLYPPLINDNKMNDIIKRSCEELDVNIKYQENCSMTGDDFSYFAQAVPSSYFKLGVADNNLGIYPLHNSKLNPDEKALDIGTAILVKSAINYMKGI